MRNDGKHELNWPLAFSGPAQLLLYTRYGDPRESGFGQKWLTTWEIREQFPWFPKLSICIHKHFRPYLEAALTELLVMGLHSEIKTVHSDYEIRLITGSDGVLSIHSWGAAIDFNAAENPLGSAGRWSPAFLEVMRKHKIHCGMDWQGRKDPMHFAMVDG